MTITIKRTAADELSKEEWTFWVHDSHAGFNIVLDHYVNATRPTKRHGWRQSDTRSYSRLFRNNMRMDEASVPLPGDVMNEAREKLIATIRVGKWEQDFGGRA